MADETDDEDRTVRVRPVITAEQLLEATKTPEVPEVPHTDIRRPDTATARAAFGEPLSVPGVNQGAIIGVALLGSITAGATAGFLVDKMTHNTGTPWGLIAGGILGVLAGVMTVRTLNQSMKP